MSINLLLFGLAILFFLIPFLLKIITFNSKEIQSHNYLDSAQNIEFKTNSIESDDYIETVVDYPIKMKNSFLNPNDDFGTIKKGVVIDNQTYEYEVVENDNSNFTIIEPVVESKEISE